MSQIIPALIVSDKNLYNDFEELREKFEKLKPFLAEFDNWIQVDITDGEFVTSKTNIGLDMLSYFTKSANVEFHLMIVRLQQTIDKWIELQPKRIIFHIETCTPEDIEMIIKKCKQAKIEIGLALNPETPFLKINPWLEAIDSVMFLGVTPGFSGQKFIPETMAKIALLRHNRSGIKIEVDGGVTVKNIGQLEKAGVDIFVIGTGILSAPDIGQAIAEFRSILSK